MTIACGGCIGCRLSHGQEWMSRIIHEASLYDPDEVWFITLTYNGENMPYGQDLVYRHIQLFNKRLRKKHPDKKIRFYCVGEYGEKHLRPHWHIIYFGLPLLDRRPIVRRGHGRWDYESDLITETWGKGYTQVAEVTPASAAYVARYALKKVNGNRAEEHYTRLVEETGELIRVSPEIQRCSQGIGKDFYEKYKDDFIKWDQNPVPNKGLLKKCPRYYLKRLEKEDPDTLAAIKEAREIFAINNADDNTPDRLRQKEICTKARLEQLERNLE